MLKWAEFSYRINVNQPEKYLLDARNGINTKLKKLIMIDQNANSPSSFASLLGKTGAEAIAAFLFGQV
jgi:hypothetical protein